MAGELPKGLIRFPLRLERIADELDSILTCCRIKARDGIEFSDKAHAELNQMLAIVLDMLENLHDVMTTPRPGGSGLHHVSGEQSGAPAPRRALDSLDPFGDR